MKENLEIDNTLCKSNQVVIDLFKEDLPTIGTLNNGNDRFVYPNIPKDKENAFRNQFGISEEETVLFIQEIDFHNKGAYEAMGFVMTDIGIRLSVADPMMVSMLTYDTVTKSRYDRDNKYLCFYDSRSKVAADNEIIPIWFVISGMNDERLINDYGVFFSDFLNRISDSCNVEIEDAEKLCREIQTNFLKLQYKREHANTITESQDLIEFRKRYITSQEKRYKNVPSPSGIKFIGGIVLALLVIVLFINGHISFGVLVGIGAFLCFVSHNDDRNEYESKRKEILKILEERKKELETIENTLKKTLAENPETATEETLDVWSRRRFAESNEYIQKMIAKDQAQQQREQVCQGEQTEQSNYTFMDGIEDFNKGVKIGKAIFNIWKVFS